jgi:dihydroxy-acid dehydratase
MPGALIAMARLNRPALMIYGGTIRAGHSPAAPGEPLDIVSAFQSYGGFAAGLIDEAARADIVRHSCPGAGACGGMYTANTMASAIEALGMALPYSSCTPAEDPMKMVECRLAGRYVLELMKRDIKPRDVMTRAAFENAMVLIMATGGSTNAVLHLLAMARAAGVELSLDDFQRVSDRTPFLCDLKPSGKYVMEDLHAVSCRAGGCGARGGVRVVLFGAVQLFSSYFIRVIIYFINPNFIQPPLRPLRRCAGAPPSGRHRHDDPAAGARGGTTTSSRG